GEGDQEIGFGGFHRSPLFADGEPFHFAAEKPNPEGVRKLVAENVGADRLLEDAENKRVGDDAGEERPLDPQKRLADQDRGIKTDRPPQSSGKKTDPEQKFNDSPPHPPNPPPF